MKKGKWRWEAREGAGNGLEGRGTLSDGTMTGAWHWWDGGGLPQRHVHTEFLCGSLSVGWQHFSGGLIAIMDTGGRTREHIQNTAEQHVHTHECMCGSQNIVSLPFCSCSPSSTLSGFIHCGELEMLLTGTSPLPVQAQWLHVQSFKALQSVCIKLWGTVLTVSRGTWDGTSSQLQTTRIQSARAGKRRRKSFITLAQSETIKDEWKSTDGWGRAKTRARKKMLSWNGDREQGNEDGRGRAPAEPERLQREKEVSGRRRVQPT